MCYEYPDGHGPILYHDSCTQTAVVSSGVCRVDLPVDSRLLGIAVVLEFDSGVQVRKVGQLERRRAVPGLAEPCEPVSVDHLPVFMESLICPRVMCCSWCRIQNCRATRRCCGEDEHPCKLIGLLRASGDVRCRHALEARSRAWMPCSRSTGVRDDSSVPTWAQGW